MATADEKYAILISQRGCCMYCGKPLDGVVFRKGKSVDLELQWDHAIPRALRVIEHESNIVASCQICNLIKSDLVFETVEEAREWINGRREEEGYSESRIAWCDIEEKTTEPPDMKCPRCGQWFQIPSALKKHVDGNPSSCETRRMQNENRKRRLEKWNEKRRSGREGVEELKKEKTVSCEICCLKFVNLGSHMRHKHNKELAAEYEEKRPRRKAERERNRTGRPAPKRPALPGSRRPPENLRSSELRPTPEG